ncbi:MAG TPA: CvpA family protein [Terriglobales bacterium]|nr:CvpA family protein [Terriglobales bacterium]
MSWADWVIVGVIALSVLMAAAQGFFVEIFSLAGVVAGYIAAAWGYRQVGEWFLPYVKTAEIANLAGFLTILFAVMIVAGMAGRIVRWAMQEAGLRWVDRLLGAAFGLVRGVVVVTVVLLGLAAFDPGASLLRSSQLAGYFLVAGRGASWLAPAEVRRKFREGLESLRKPQPQPEVRENGRRS